MPKNTVQGAEVAKKASKAIKSTEILKKASGLFTLEEISRNGVERARKAPKPRS